MHCHKQFYLFQQQRHEATNIIATVSNDSTPSDSDPPYMNLSPHSTNPQETTPTYINVNDTDEVKKKDKTTSGLDEIIVLAFLFFQDMIKKLGLKDWLAY